MRTADTRINANAKYNNTAEQYLEYYNGIYDIQPANHLRMRRMYSIFI